MKSLLLRGALAAVSLFLSLATPSFAGPGVDSTARQAVDLMARMNYPAAESRVLSGIPHDSPAQPFYAGLVCLNRFLDLGDTAALRRAEAYWDRISPQGQPRDAFRDADPGELALYRGLAGIQLSYLASLRGAHLRPATLALAARRHLLDRPEPEARASLMLYDHYRARLLGKIPFVSAGDFPTAEFRRLVEPSPLRDIFLSSLFWIHVDAGRTAAALAIGENIVGRHPANRLAREMRADGYQRAGRFDEAREEYESLAREYAQVRKAPDRLPLGYYRSVGNLARIYEALGMTKESRARLKEWDRATRGAASPWLPASLKRELARLGAEGY